MKPEEQSNCMTSVGWLAERKLNGVRMLITYHPSVGFEFFSRNLSVTNFLPSQYTDTILIEWHGKLHEPKDFVGMYDEAFVLDSEVCSNVVKIDTTIYKKKGGTVTNSQLNAVTTTLSIEPEISHKIQREQCALSLIVFDCLVCESESVQDESLLARKSAEEHVVKMLTEDGITIEEVDWTAINKEEFYQDIVDSGGEGIVLKKKSTPYCSTGSRSKEGFVKRKRTVSEAYGSDIDAYITGATPANKTSRISHLIGAVDMAVLLQKKDGSEEEVILASVGAMPLEMREELTILVEGKPALNPKYLRKVLIIDGQDISPKAKRFRHARADWDRGFREDKNSIDCRMEEEFIESQIF
jgi:ATP-dependent DNA ligase